MLLAIIQFASIISHLFNKYLIYRDFHNIGPDVFKEVCSGFDVHGKGLRFIFNYVDKKLAISIDQDQT